MASNRSDELSCSGGAKPRVRVRTLLMQPRPARVVGRPWGSLCFLCDCIYAGMCSKKWSERGLGREPGAGLGKGDGGRGGLPMGVAE